MQPSKDIQRLIDIMAALRTPGTGCPWDLEQTHRTLAPYALEEAYELVDAIEREDPFDLCDELGDLLLQVVFHARVAEEAGVFGFGDIVATVTAKLVRRHPHVFAAPPVEEPVPVKKDGLSGVDLVWEAMKAKRMKRESEARREQNGLLAAMPVARRLDAVNANWEAIKAEERKAKGKSEGPRSLLAHVPNALPGLTRAVKLQKKASSVGFDWGDVRLVLAKIREEIDEIDEALDAHGANGQAANGNAANGNAKAVTDEIGDLIFAVANLARHADVDPETAVRGTNAKFERRFAYIEKELSARGSSPEASTLAEMDRLWDAAKAAGL